jgi:O-antigen/teichoic acid export membrane protein
VAKTFGWLLGDLTLKVLGGGVVGVMLARHFGPADYGRLAVAMSCANIGKDFVSFGLNRIVQRELSSQRSRAGLIVGTHLALGLVGAAFIIAATSWFAFQIDDVVTCRLTLILAWLSLPSAFGGADIWFSSQGDIRTVTLVKNATWAFFMAARLGFIFLNAPLPVFALVAVADWTISFTVAWIVLWRRTTIIRRLHFSPLLARTWARYGWPSTILMLITAVTDRIQQYLVQDMAGPAAAGVFGAGYRLAELWWTIAPLAAVAILPRLARQHQQAEAGYHRELQTYFDLSSVVTIAVALVVTLAAPLVIPWVLGERYASSSSVMILLIWAAPPIFSAFARTQHLTVKKTLLVELPNSLTSAVLSLVLSFELTPRFGATGAATAILIGWWVGVFVTPWLVPSARKIARVQLWSLTSILRIPHLWRDASSLVRTLRSGGPAKNP